MEEKVEGGPPEEKNQKREEVRKEKEKENVQKTFEERIGFLEKELEAAFAEISLRKEEQSKFLEDNEELRAENQHLSNIIGSLQIDKQIDMENLTTKNDDLERTNEHLKKEICNQEVILEQYKNELMKKEKENIKLKDKLEKVRQNKRKLEKFTEKKMEDELLAANEIIPSLKEELEEGDKTKEENRPRMTKLRLNRTSLKMDIKDGQKDVQKNDRDNKSEEKVVEAQDQDTNGRKAEKEEVGGASGVGQVEGGPPEEKNQKREEVEKEKEKENVQKTFEERIGFLEKELEAAFAEISLRKEEQSKFLEENEELRAENQHLSNIIGSLQIDKQIDMENLTTKNDDLERTNEHLKKEICNQEVILEQYKNELMEKEKENIKLKDKLEKVRQNKRKLEKFTEKKMEVIKQISEQTHQLEESLNEAKMNDLLRNERYKCILQELENYKKEHLKLSDLEKKTSN
ncbi:golgin subfamily A member 6-like protein 24 [Palaemon carinicauda]|uniref:golgin subfamily A member 6-like protein 24 n=1 Tax=Palaemon carinicauda TaxID=392227 RepID=UPI0035B627DA